MDKEQFSALVQKYLEGNATNEEKQFLEAYYEEMDSERTIENILTQKEIDELEDALYGQILSTIKEPKVKPIGINRSYRKYAAIAASLIVLISAALYLYFRTPGDSSMIAYAQTGNIVKFELSDGTRIWLNSKSKLTYPSSFKNKKLREVYLEGEAYFEVKHDKEHPFLVHTRNLTTRVLGTRFNIQAYKGTSHIEVTLLQGKVMLTTDALSARRDHNKPDTVFLKPNEKAVYAAGSIKNLSLAGDRSGLIAKVNKGQGIQKSGLSDSEALSKFTVPDASVSSAWRNGELIFNREPLENVLASLSGKYNVVIRSAPALNNYPITAEFGDESIDDILIAITNQIKRKEVKDKATGETNAEFKKLGADYYIE